MTAVNVCSHRVVVDHGDSRRREIDVEREARLEQPFNISLSLFVQNGIVSVKIIANTFEL